MLNITTVTTVTTNMLNNVTYGSIWILFLSVIGFFFFVVIVIFAYSFLFKKFQKLIFSICYSRNTNEYQSLKSFKSQNKKNRFKNGIKVAVSWTESIFVIATISAIVLTVLKILNLKEEIMSLTISLFVVVLGSIILQIMRYRYNIDYYYFFPKVKIGQKIMINGDEGIVYSITRTAFWIITDKNNEIRISFSMIKTNKLHFLKN